MAVKWLYIVFLHTAFCVVLVPRGSTVKYSLLFPTVSVLAYCSWCWIECLFLIDIVLSIYLVWLVVDSLLLLISTAANMYVLLLMGLPNKYHYLSAMPLFLLCLIDTTIKVLIFLASLIIRSGVVTKLVLLKEVSTYVCYITLLGLTV